jgi:hypothetical protein
MIYKVVGVLPNRKDRHFNKVFTFWGISGGVASGRGPFLHLTYDGAEELIIEEFEKPKNNITIR